MSKPVAVITGASGGIGAATARALAADGHAVVLGARREEALRDVAASIGDAALPVVTDVRVRTDVERLRDRALERFGRVDVWINNAGRGITRRVMELSDEDCDAMIAVNLKAMLYGTQTIVPHFQERGDGHLINISSFLGRVPLVAHRSMYSAAKAALNVLTANLRMDLSRTHPGIHVSLVMAGLVDTDFPRNVLGGPAPERVGAPRGQSADEIAAAIRELIAHPVAELYTDPRSAELCKRYFNDVAAFEAEASRNWGGR